MDTAVKLQRINKEMIRNRINKSEIIMKLTIGNYKAIQISTYEYE